MHYPYLRPLFFAATLLSVSVPHVLADVNDGSTTPSEDLLSESNALSAVNLPMHVDFPDAPDSATNVVQDNFLGISFELSVLNYLCESPLHASCHLFGC